MDWIAGAWGWLGGHWHWLMIGYFLWDISTYTRDIQRRLWEINERDKASDRDRS